MSADLTSFLAQKRRWHTISQTDLNQAANALIICRDGNLARREALWMARAVFEAVGMEVTRAQPEPQS